MCNMHFAHNFTRNHTGEYLFMLSANHSSWKSTDSKPSEWLAFCVPSLGLIPQQYTEFNAPVRFHVKLCAKCALAAAARSICPACSERELLRDSPCEFLTTQHSFSVSFWMFIGLLWALYYTTRRLKRVSKTTEAVNHVCWCPSQDSNPISLHPWQHIRWTESCSS